jgi:hypothetical protein
MMYIDAVLEMVLFSSYQTRWSSYWVTTDEMLLAEDDFEIQNQPSKLFCRVSSTGKFGSWISGLLPHFSPPGIDFHKLFFGAY